MEADFLGCSSKERMPNRQWKEMYEEKMGNAQFSPTEGKIFFLWLLLVLFVLFLKGFLNHFDHGIFNMSL